MLGLKGGLLDHHGHLFLKRRSTHPREGDRDIDRLKPDTCSLRRNKIGTSQVVLGTCKSFGVRSLLRLGIFGLLALEPSHPFTFLVILMVI